MSQISGKLTISESENIDKQIEFAKEEYSSALKKHTNLQNTPPESKSATKKRNEDIKKSENTIEEKKTALENLEKKKQEIEETLKKKIKKVFSEEIEEKEEENTSILPKDISVDEQTKKKKDAAKKLKDTMKTSGIIQTPSDLLGIDTMLYYELKRKQNLEDIVGQTDKLKKEMTGYEYENKKKEKKKVTGVKEYAENAWKNIYDEIDLLNPSLPRNEKQRIADKVLVLERDKRLEILNLRYPFLK